MWKSLSNIVSGAIGEKARLVLEYVLVGLLVATLAMTGTLYISKLRQEVKVAKLEGEVITLNGEVSSLSSVTQQQGDNIQELKRLRYVDAETLGKLLADLKNLSDKDTQFQTKLARLEASDETVREYMSNGIPPQLRCVLNDTCEKPAPVSPAGQKPGAAATTPSGPSPRS